jgi:hypothetical protein
MQVAEKIQSAKLGKKGGAGRDKHSSSVVSSSKRNNDLPL